MSTNPYPPVDLEPDLEPDVSHIVIEDGAPVDGMYAERAMRLLVEPLYASWRPPVGDDGEVLPFVAFANVGVFGGVHEAPLVPDVMLSVGVSMHPAVGREKKHNTYFIWEFGKPPDVVIEVVSNREGEELTKRKHGYRRWKVPYYVVWDPFDWLHQGELQAFELRGDLYQAVEPTFAPLGLSLVPWEGEFESLEGRWLRWAQAGVVLPTGVERAEAESERAVAASERAEAESERAEAERSRADRLHALLLAHGLTEGLDEP